MSRRRALNRRELLLPLREPDPKQAGIALDLCVSPLPTVASPAKTGEPPESWPHRSKNCRQAKQRSDTLGGLIAGNGLLARLIFQRIRPRTHFGMSNEQGRSHELKGTAASITPPDITMPPDIYVDASVPAPIPAEIGTLFTQLARRRLRNRAIQEKT